MNNRNRASCKRQTLGRSKFAHSTHTKHSIYKRQLTRAFFCYFVQWRYSSAFIVLESEIEFQVALFMFTHYRNDSFILLELVLNHKRETNHLHIEKRLFTDSFQFHLLLGHIIIMQISLFSTKQITTSREKKTLDKEVHNKIPDFGRKKRRY